MKTLSKTLLALALCANIYAQEPADTTLIDRLPVETESPPIENYSVADVENLETLEVYDQRLDLLLFTYKEKGMCRACDVSRDTIKRLAKKYPVTYVYVDGYRGFNQMDAWDVHATPTYILTRRGRNGNAVELDRLVGYAGLERWVRTEFEVYGYDDETYDGDKAAIRPIPKRAPKKREQTQDERAKSFWERLFGL